MLLRHCFGIGRCLRDHVIDAFLAHVVIPAAAVIDKSEYARINSMLGGSMDAAFEAIEVNVSEETIEKLLGSGILINKGLGHFCRCGGNLHRTGGFRCAEHRMARNVLRSKKTKSFFATFLHLKGGNRYAIFLRMITAAMRALLRHRFLSTEHRFKGLLRNLIAHHGGSIKVAEGTFAILGRKNTAMNIHFDLGLRQIPIHSILKRLEGDEVRPRIIKAGMRFFVHVDALKSNLL